LGEWRRKEGRSGGRTKQIKRGKARGATGKEVSSEPCERGRKGRATESAWRGRVGRQDGKRRRVDRKKGGGQGHNAGLEACSRIRG